MIRVIVLAMALCSFAGVSLAQDITLDEMFGLVGMNSPRGADALSIGNATVATPGFSSDNPAILTTYRNGDMFNLSAFGGEIALEHGPKVAMHAEALTVNMPVGTGQIYFSDAFSSRHETPLGMDIEVNRVQKLNFMYGLEVGQNLLSKDDSLSLGLSFTPSVGKTELSFYSDDMRIANSVSSEYSIGGGILYRPTKQVSIGAVYQESYATTKQTDIFSDEPKKVRSKSKSGKVGIAVQATEKLLVTAEYQHIGLETVSRNQVAGGAEYCIKPSVCVYAGYNGNGATGGVGIYPNKHVSLNLSVAQNISSDTRRSLDGAMDDGRPKSFDDSPAITAQINISF